MSSARKIALWIALAGFGGGLTHSAFGLSWSLDVGCPGSGTLFDGAFSAISGGFSGYGRCTRSNTRLTAFEFRESTGGTLIQSTAYGLHTGDVLVIPPLLDVETEPIFAVSPRCPFLGKNLNFVFVKWGNMSRVLDNNLVSGNATFSTSTGLAVTARYDITNQLVSGQLIPLPGSCANGLYYLSGAGDQGGTIFMTMTGTGAFETASGNAAFFVPRYEIDAVADLANIDGNAIFFDSNSASNTRTAKVTSNAAGDQLTLEPYSNPLTGAIDALYVDVLDLSNFNQPQDGMVRGTLTRVGSGAGTGRVACIGFRGVNMRLLCSGESPNDNSVPYTITITVEGPKVLGQPTALSSDGVRLGMSYPFSIWSDGTRLAVVDQGNNRVLLYNHIPSGQTQPDVVIGQPNLNSSYGNVGGVPSASSLLFPNSVTVAGGKLYVADSGNNRVLVWNAMPSYHGQPADGVLGQSNFTENEPATVANGFYFPSAVASDGTNFFVADCVNHRVLIWHLLPTNSSQLPSAVVGQPDFETAESTLDEYGFSCPTGVSSDGVHVAVADSENNRVLIWDAIPTSAGPPASVVLGQTDFYQNNYGDTPDGLTYPMAVLIESGRLWVTDSGNNRVLRWDSVPVASSLPADGYLGEFHEFFYATADTLRSPTGLFSDGTRFFVADSDNSRVLIWNSIPLTDGAAANQVVGQTSLDRQNTNSNPTSRTSLLRPSDVHGDGTRLFVADSASNRVLIWNSEPTRNQDAPSLVLGQATFTEDTLYTDSAVTASTLTSPRSVYSSGTRLCVADADSNRVLVWTTMPTSNNEQADLVLGQPDMVSSSYGAGASQMRGPNAVTCAGDEMFVADSSNHRVLGWSTFPTANGQPADIVLGQSGFDLSSPNRGSTANQNTLYYPLGLYRDAGGLYVTDYVNRRVLYYSSLVPATDNNPSLVIGQSDMTSVDCSVTANRLCGPVYVTGDATGRLYVSDPNSHRILVWEASPSVNGQAADAVLAQPNFTSGDAGYSENQMDYPMGLYSRANRVFAVDGNNDRVIVFERP